MAQTFMAACCFLCERQLIAGQSKEEWKGWIVHRECMVWAKDKEINMAQRASMGRIVIYKHPGSLDGKFPPRESPAIIQEVLDESTGLCRLFVLGPKGQHMDEVTYGDRPCQWHWPIIY